MFALRCASHVTCDIQLDTRRGPRLWWSCLSPSQSVVPTTQTPGRQHCFLSDISVAIKRAMFWQIFGYRQLSLLLVTRPEAPVFCLIRGASHNHGCSVISSLDPDPCPVPYPLQLSSARSVVVALQEHRCSVPSTSLDNYAPFFLIQYTPSATFHTLVNSVHGRE